MLKKLQVISRFVGRTNLKLRASSPTILTLGGVAALVAAGVYAVRVTHKMEPVVEELSEDLDNIADNKTMTPDEKVQQKIRAYTNAAVKTAIVYGPSIAMVAAGTASILYGHGILKRRNAALMAAYGVLERTYQAYRDRVRETFGEDIEDRIERGYTLKISEVDGENKQVIYEPTKYSRPEGHSEYAVEFDSTNPNWNPNLPDYNLVFLRAQEKYANHRLQSRGHVLLNDIYDAIGIPRTKAGCVVGWVRTGPDGYIDFGLPEAGSPEESDYFYFYDGEGAIYLDFNVDGLVYDKI